MSELIEQQLALFTIPEIEALSAEQVNTLYNKLKQFCRAAYANKSLIENVIIRRMKNEGAKKLSVGDAVYALKPGKYSMPKGAEKIWEAAGYQLNEIGTFEFKASWLAAKKLSEFGGEKAKLIEQIFEQGKETLEEMK